MLFLIVFISDILLAKTASPSNLLINWLNKAPWSIINNRMIKKIFISQSQKYDDLKTTDTSTVKQFFLKVMLVILYI